MADVPDQPAQADEAESTPMRRKGRWKRRLFVASGVLVILLAGLVALGPTLLSTGPGNRFVANLIEGQINGSVDLGKLSIGWGSGLTLEGTMVEDDKARRVLELAKLDTSLTASDLIGIAFGGDLDLGDVTIDANFPVVHVYPDNTTNLERLVGPFDDSSEPVAVTGQFDIRRLEATVQRVDEAGELLRDDTGFGLPYVTALVRDSQVTVADDSLTNDVSIDLSVNAKPAGKVTVAGDLNGMPADIVQTLTLNDVDLAAMSLLASAVETDLVVRPSGIATGSLQLDGPGQAVTGSFRVADLRIDPADGEGYAAETAQLTIAGDIGEFDGQRLARVTEIKLVAPKGTASASADVDLDVQDEFGTIPALRDVAIDVDLPFLKAEGGGPSLAALDVQFETSADELQRHLRDFVAFEGVRYAGRVDRGRLRTIDRGGRLGVRVDGVARDVVYEDLEAVDAEPTELAEATFAGFLTLDPANTEQFSDVGLRLDVPDVADVAVDIGVVDLDRNAENVRLAVTSPAVVAEATMSLAAEGTRFVISDDATATVNNGSVTLAAIAFDTETGFIDVPAGPLTSGVELNRGLADALGRYVHPVMTDPQSASGLLDVTLVDAARIDTAALGQSIASVEYAIRELAVDNDVVPALADELTGQARQAVLAKAGRARQIPGLDIDGLVERRLQLSDYVKTQLDTVRGDVDGRVDFSGGTAITTLTIALADPRQGRADDPTRYPLTFTGDVDIESLALNMSATMPTSLIEKWAGDNPSDLVDLFGENPFQTLLGDGVTLRFDGTTPAPRVDATGELDAVAERAVAALIDNAGAGLLQRGLRGLFD